MVAHELYRLAHALRHRWRMWRGTPLSGVSIIAQDWEGRLLLMRHSYGPNGWHLPGGGISRRETPQDAAVRELREETGCRAEGVRAVGTLDEVISGSPHTAHLFGCFTNDQPVPDGREVVEARFFPLHSLPEPLGERTRARLEAWREFERASQQR